MEIGNNIHVYICIVHDFSSLLSFLITVTHSTALVRNVSTKISSSYYSIALLTTTLVTGMTHTHQRAIHQKQRTNNNNLLLNDAEHASPKHSKILL